MSKKRQAGDGTRRQNPVLHREAEQMLAAVRTIWKLLQRNPYDEAEHAGITGPQVTVLACLVSRGAMTLTELSRNLGMSHSSVSGIIDRLEARGLVRRTGDTRDRRRTSIGVTEDVQAYVRELEAGPSGRLARRLAEATAAERAAIGKGLELLRRLLAQNGETH